MIEKHIVNIGLPRSGTTWLWKCGEFEPKGDKENDILMKSLEFDRYIKYYNQFQVSANFQPNLWCVDREIIQFVQQHATHITFIVRNPFDFVERYFDWIHRDQEVAALVNYILSRKFINYKNIVDRWSTGAAKFQVFFFDDLDQNPSAFFKEYMSFCQLPVVENNMFDYNKQVNANPKQKKIKIDFTDKQILAINSEIDRFQSIVDRDLTRWKK
jgi:hypothetical protein